MSTVAETTTTVIVASFEAVKLAIRGAEAGLGYESGQIGYGTVEQSAGQRAGVHNLYERSSAFFQLRKTFSEMLRGAPGICILGAVVVPDHIVFMAFGCIPAGPGRSAIRKVPGEQKRVFGLLAGLDLAKET